MTPNLLACARLLSGRALLTMSDLARLPFRTPHFRPVHIPTRARLRLEPSGCVRHTPRDHARLGNVGKLSALILTTDGRVATLTRRHPHADSRPPFDLRLPDCDPPAALPSHLIGPNSLAGAMASTLFASLCIIAPYLQHYAAKYVA